MVSPDQEVLLDILPGTNYVIGDGFDSSMRLSDHAKYLIVILRERWSMAVWKANF